MNIGKIKEMFIQTLRIPGSVYNLIEENSVVNKLDCNITAFHHQSKWIKITGISYVNFYII